MEREALLATGGVLSRANGNPSFKDFIEALKNMSASYANWNWIPIPIATGVLFKFPSVGRLNILTKREVIPCNNGHFVVSRWKEDKEGRTHIFPCKLAVLAFNVPPFLRTEQDLARMIGNFAHLIEASQVLEEGGPMRLIVGCKSRSDIPRELPVVVGGKEYKIALAIREVMGGWRKEEEKEKVTGADRPEIDLQSRSGQEGRETKRHDRPGKAIVARKDDGGQAAVVVGGQASPSPSAEEHADFG